MSFGQLGLLPELLKTIEKQGYSEPTPIQEKAIPAILEGQDIMGGAQTGTGKTAAFALPIIQKIQLDKQHCNSPRALVLAPTRELAAQVRESARAYAHGSRVRVAVVFGGVGIQPQIKILKKGTDMLVATPGRLLDLANQRVVDLSQVNTLVLDEADRMLDMGFLPDIKRVLALLPEERQNLLFSATYAAPIKKLADKLLNAPVMVEVPRKKMTAENVEMVVHPVERAAKKDLLKELIEEGEWTQALVFTRTKHRANRLAMFLDKKGIRSAAIHGDKSQGARTKALRQFKDGSIRMLVATDIAARGLDIPSLPQVVNFDLPNVAEDFVHRVGRTGRAGQSGFAVSLVATEEKKLMRDIERLLGRPLAVEARDGFAFEEGVEEEVTPRHKRHSSGRSRGRQGDRAGGSHSRPGKRRRPAKGNSQRAARAS